MNIWKAKVSQPVSYFKCGQFVCEDQWYHERLRLEQDYEVIIGIRGYLHIQVEEQRYTVGPGEVLFYQPGQLHYGFAPSEEGSSFYWLHFFDHGGENVEMREVLELLDRQQVAAKEMVVDENERIRRAINVTTPTNINNSTKVIETVEALGANSHTSQILPLADSVLLPPFFKLVQPDKVYVQCQQLLDIAHSDYYSHLAADYMTTSLLIELTRQFIGSLSERTQENIVDRRFRQLLEWIRLRIMNNPSVQDVAVQFGCTPDHLTRQFRKKLGMSTLRYMNTIKIERAKELLLHSDATIKQIAYMLHFQDDKYFMKLFKQQEGLTPSQYRDAYPNTYMNTNSLDPDIPLPAHLADKNPTYKGSRPYG